MTRHYDNLGPFMDTERLRDAVRVKASTPAVTGGVGWGGMAADICQPATEDEIRARAKTEMERHHAFLQTTESRLLGAISDAARALEEVRSCYCRGFSGKGELDAAWAHLTDATQAVAHATAALAEITGK